MGLHPRYFGMNERQVCAMAMLMRSGSGPYDAQSAAKIWEIRHSSARRWLKELMDDVEVLEVVSRTTNRNGEDRKYRPTQLWAEAVRDATEKGEVLGKCPGCGLEAVDLVRWYRPPADSGSKGGQWGYWCGDCMTLEDTDTDCPRCYYGMTVTEITDEQRAAVGLVYLKAICRRCKLRIDSAGLGMYEARVDLEAAKRRRAWEWVTQGPRWKERRVACR